MIQINDRTPTIKDVVQISGKAAALPVLDYLKELKDAWTERYGDQAIFNEYRFVLLLADAFTAGYMQGKREERARQRLKGVRVWATKAHVARESRHNAAD